MSTADFTLRTCRLSNSGFDQVECTPGTETIFYGIVGQATDVAFLSPLGAATLTVVSQPVGSSIDFDGSNITPTKSGDHRLTMQNASLSPVSALWRVYQPEALTHPSVKSPFPNGGHPSTTYSGSNRSESQVRVILLKAARGAYGDVSAATLAATTALAPIPAGLRLPSGTGAQG